MKNDINTQIERYSPDIDFGLSNEQVNERIKNKLVNKTKITVGKSYWEIIFTNLLSLFNITLFIIAGVLIAFKRYGDLFFLVVLIPNILIGLYEDISARILMGKLKLQSNPRVVVVRNGTSTEIFGNEIVLDDIVLLKGNNQICFDGIVVDGTIAVNESLLTGESVNVYKKPGDVIYSGSFVVTGSAYVRADKVGKKCYIETLQNKANKFHRSPSEILKSLRALFRIIGAFVFAMATFMIVTFVLQKRDFNSDLIGKITGSLIAMIPSGLYLLTSMTLALAVISLSKRQAQVQDFYSVEMLARVDTLCVDKTGTITDGSMVVKEVQVLSLQHNNATVNQIMVNMLSSLGGDSCTAQALKEYFDGPSTKNPTKVLHFTSDNKYSAVSFDNEKIYVLGAPEFIGIKNLKSVEQISDQYLCKGNRVLVLAEGKGDIIDNKISGNFSAIALFILEDHIKDNAIETFKWFNDNSVNIKVISGDNALAVSEIAKSAGILNADKYISLEGIEIEKISELAENYTVFGRVTPEQKEELIKCLKNKGHVVGMTGDGVNDILALKRADCSIAMATGAEAARNVSHIVLTDSNFNHLPEVVAEGRRIVNNLQRTCSLFLTKTIFAITLTLFFTLMSIIKNDPTINYPFEPNNLYAWEIINIGFAAFCLALQKNSEPIKGKFLENVFSKALPCSLAIISSVLVLYIFHDFDSNNLIYLSMDSPETFRSISVLAISIESIYALYCIASPLDKYRTIVFAISTALTIFVFAIGYYLRNKFGPQYSLIQVSYEILNIRNIIMGVMVIIVIISVRNLIKSTIRFIQFLKENKNENRT